VGAPGPGVGPLTDLPGLDRDRVAAWLRDRVDAAPPLRFSLVPAGGSNLTYRVDDDAGHRWALRRPPVAAVLETAHDVTREWRILEALGRHTDVPVPPTVAYCGDADVTGAPFYLMRFVDGRVLRTDADTSTLTASAAETATDSLVDAQVALHAVDPDAVGLGDLTRHRHDYVARQLHRWRAQVERAKVRELPRLDDLHDRLAATVPPAAGPATLVHGDYRFDNTILGDDHRIVAVLDWELGTIGDPVADCCWSLLYWVDPGDPAPFLPASPTLAPALPRRADVARRYADRSGRDLDALPWFTVFGYWKMACIVEGVYTRRRRGGRGGAGSQDLASIADRVVALLDRATELASGVC
jgi:aminoglycoside phosphotransferase (APT) family kinase protein